MAKCSQRTARTRVPPIGKIPVSIAALRTTSTTLAMSTRESRLAEYSSVKCGMMDYSSGGSVSGEVAAHAAVRTIVGLNRVAFAGLDRADERSGQHDLACLEGQAQRRDLVGEPRHAGGGMVEYAGGKPGLFQLAVAIAQRADPAQVGVQRTDWTSAEHDAGVRSVVGNRVEYLAGRLGLRIDALDPGVEDFQRRHHEIGRVEHVEHGAARTCQALLHDEGELGFDPRADKAIRRHQPAIGEEHVVEQHAGIRLVDIERALHRFRGEADLVALDHVAPRDLDRDPRFLDRVGVLDGDAGMVQRNLPDLLAGFFRIVEPLGGEADIILGEGHARSMLREREYEKWMRKYD